MSSQETEPQPEVQKKDSGKAEADKDRKEKGKEKEKDKEEAARAERAKADRLWADYLGMDSSPITDLFGGQLQSSIVCQKCNGRFTMYAAPRVVFPSFCGWGWRLTGVPHFVLICYKELNYEAFCSTWEP